MNIQEQRTSLTLLFKIHSYKPIEKYEEKNDMGGRQN